MDVQVVYIMLGGRAVRYHICSLDEVINTPGVQHLIPSDSFTCIVHVVPSSDYSVKARRLDLDRRFSWVVQNMSSNE